MGVELHVLRPCNSHPSRANLHFFSHGLGLGLCLVLQASRRKTSTVLHYFVLH